MKREISSRSTKFYRTFVPVVSLLIFGGYTLSYFVGILNRFGAEGLEWGILFSGIMALAATWTSSKLMRVAVDSHFLYVSNGRKELRVPLSSISSVEQFGGGYKTIVVTLETPSQFGDRVMFLPRDRTAKDPTSGLHPTVVELRRAQNDQRNSS